MQLTAQRAGDQLTIHLTGRLDATSAAALEQALQLEGVGQLVLDLDSCTFISSAGLRELLRAQKRLTALGGTMVMTHVSRSIQEVLDVTGLSRLVQCKPKLRQISIEGLEFLSEGVCGECFRLDEETIVKLYREGIAPEIAEKEKEFAKAAFVSGIPTAISYDVVACGNRTGVVYEMLDATLFSAVIKNDLAHIEQHAQTLAQIAMNFHATVADPKVFPDIKEGFRAYIDQMDFFMSADEIAFLHRKLESIPDADTCIHCDLHTSNIMIRAGEPVVIDMGDVSRGHYLFDIGLMATIYGVPELEICEMATKLPRDEGVRLYDHFIEHYFAHKTADELEFFQRNVHFLASLRLIYAITFAPRLKQQLATSIRKVLLPKIMAGESAH